MNIQKNQFSHTIVEDVMLLNVVSADDSKIYNIFSFSPWLSNLFFFFSQKEKLAAVNIISIFNISVELSSKVLHRPYL